MNSVKTVHKTETTLPPEKADNIGQCLQIIDKTGKIILLSACQSVILTLVPSTTLALMSHIHSLTMAKAA